MIDRRTNERSLRDEESRFITTHPVLVLQHVDLDGPAFLGEWLGRNGIAFEVRNSEAGDAFPADLEGYRALAILGGPMSANDDLPSLRRAEHLVRDAVARGVPVIGHCLGGQLMAKALGGRVRPAPVPEIGWHRIDVLATAAAREWFGVWGDVAVFQWHHDAFELPPGAEPLARSETCVQAFAIGPHLAMQFHVEIDRGKLDRWSTSGEDELARLRGAHPGTVQSAVEMRAEAEAWLIAQKGLAERVYQRWLDLR